MLIAVWIVVGVVLLAVEMHHWAFFALFGALGSFAAAGVAAVAPSAVPAQVGTGIATAAVGIVAVRPFVSRVVHRHRGGRVALGVHGGLVDVETVALDRIGGRHAPGHVRLAGERWLAVSGDGRVIEPGSTVLVTGVEGTTLTVWLTADPELPLSPID